MKRTPVLLSTLSIAALLAGCISVAPEEKDATVRRGNAPASVVDLQAATKALTVYDATPAGAEVLADVSAIRCHANLYEPKPTEETVRADLLINAFGKGANAISNIQVVRQPGNLGYNCYFRYFGTAKALKVDGK
ncbi:hypothetical protein [Achromobacter insolitus]|uniref:hypothetical protein n=1 Tax=Achromobacter insolitus TaxID=217204 RepID=UPI002FDFB4CF